MKNSNQSTLIGDFSSYAMSQQQKEQIRGQKLEITQYIEEQIGECGVTLYFLHTITYDTDTQKRTRTCIQVADIASF